MNYIEIFEKHGSEGLALLMFGLFSVWLFKSFYERHKERNNREEDLNLQGLSVLSKALCSCVELKLAPENTTQTGLMLLYESIPYMSATDHEGYLAALNNKDYDKIHEILNRRLRLMQSMRFDRLSDGQSFVLVVRNVFRRSFIGSLGFTFYTLFMLLCGLGYLVALLARVPDGRLPLSVLDISLASAVVAVAGSRLDAILRNRAIPHFMLVIAILGYTTVIVGSAVLLYLGFCIWKPWILPAVYASFVGLCYYAEYLVRNKWRNTN